MLIEPELVLLLQVLVIELVMFELLVNDRDEDDFELESWVFLCSQPCIKGFCVCSLYVRLSNGGLLETILTMFGLLIGWSKLDLEPVSSHSFRLKFELLFLLLLLWRFAESIRLMPIKLGVLGESIDSTEFLFELVDMKSHLFDLLFQNFKSLFSKYI